MSRLAKLFLGILVACGLGINSPALAQEDAEVRALREQVSQLYDENRFAEAAPIAERYAYLARERNGENTAVYATSLTWLGYIYQGQNRNTEAEPLFKRALEIYELSYGPDSSAVGTALDNLARLYLDDGRYDEAEPLYQRAVLIREKASGGDQLDLVYAIGQLAYLLQKKGHYSEAEPLFQRAVNLAETSPGTNKIGLSNALNSLALLYDEQGRYGLAEANYNRSLEIRKEAFGPDHADVANSLNNLAHLFYNQGRFSEAEPMNLRALAIREKVFGPDHLEVAVSLNNLAAVYRETGNYQKAEALYVRALTIREKALRPDHPDIGNIVGGLALLLTDEGRYGDAEPLYKRALSIREKALGPNHPDVAITLSNIALLYQSQGRYAEAESLDKRALEIRKTVLGSDHPDVASSLENLGALYNDMGLLKNSETAYLSSLDIRQRVLGPTHPRVGSTLNNLAFLYDAQGRPDEAESFYRRSLSISESTLGSDHPTVGAILSNLADTRFVKNDWVGAAELWRRSTDVLINRAKRGVSNDNSSQPRLGHDARFAGLTKATYRLALEAKNSGSDLANEMFQAAQWARYSEAAASLAKMGLRSAAGNPELAAIVRERQDLVTEWQERVAVRTAAFSQAPSVRDTQSKDANNSKLAAVDTRIAEIDKQLAKGFPNYAAFASPKPLSIVEVQSQLGDGEALVLFLDTPELKPTPEETFIWAVTKSDSRWVKSDFGSKVLGERVGALRCGLDEQAWSGEGRKNCEKLLGFAPADGWQRGMALPFDVAKAHDLYKGIFGEVENLLKDKELIIVPSGALTSLPFQVLVTKPPASPPNVQDYRNAAWLARDHAITVLPSVASLSALRRDAKTSAATKPFIGFGNPVLTGSTRCGKMFVPDKCPEEEIKVAVTASSDVSRSTGEIDATAQYFRNGLADVAAIKTRLCPLPDTAHELKCVARSLGAPDSSIIVGKDMTETALKTASLSQYRVIHFATHGLLAGETAQLSAAHAEPALVMSPPDNPTEDDDGLLTASEVAGLKLDADWVVMSACNTAGGGALGAEALSGLARAFFYAGARALLVSHWPVNSYAATMLTSRTFAEMKKDTSLGRSEAFRRAMLALMSDEKRPWAAHPSVWAPFVVVGEGGAKR